MFRKRKEQPMNAPEAEPDKVEPIKIVFPDTYKSLVVPSEFASAARVLREIDEDAKLTEEERLVVRNYFVEKWRELISNRAK